MITSGCSTAMETVLFDLGNDLPSRLRDMAHMPNIVDELNRSEYELSIWVYTSWICYCNHVSKHWQ